MGDPTKIFSSYHCVSEAEGNDYIHNLSFFTKDFDVFIFSNHFKHQK